MASKPIDLGSLDVTLYHMHRVRSTRVTWLLYELDAIDNVKINEINLLKGEHQTPGFLAISKMGTLPTLTVKETDGDTSMVMMESSAICMWLTDMVPEGGLKPDGSNVFGLGQYYRFIAFAAASMDPLLWDIRLHEQSLPESRQVEQVADAARKNFMQKIVPTLEDVFKGDEEIEFVCEPYHKGFTAADVMVGYALYWSTMYGLLDDSPVLRAYLRRLMDRKQFRAATTATAAL